MSERRAGHVARVAVRMPFFPTSRVLLTGADAQLASAVRARLAPLYVVTALGRRELDITSAAAVAGAFRELRPDAVVNCASFNDVDGAELRAAEALAVNGLAVATLAREAAAADALLVHYSTDFVFDPTTDPGPLAESAPVRPRSVYGQSKLLGELYARRAPRHYVLRVESLFGGTPAKSSIDSMAATLRGGGIVRAFADRTVSPSYVHDVADATARLLGSAVPSGLYHCVNSGHGTWLDVATVLARELGANPALVTGVPFASLSLRAPRPQFAALSNAALAAHGVTLPAWPDALARYVRALDAA
ncbi:MAG: NAD(P)-dependent oxidoreductase [Acidobacteriota bacterium]